MAWRAMILAAAGMRISQRSGWRQQRHFPTASSAVPRPETVRAFRRQTDLQLVIRAIAVDVSAGGLCTIGQAWRVSPQSVLLWEERLSLASAALQT